LEELRGRAGRKQTHGASDDPGPSSLVAGTETGSVVTVKVLVEQNMIAPVRVFLKLRGAAVNWSAADSFISRQPADHLKSWPAW
jgi:hypothetical protein